MALKKEECKEPSFNDYLSEIAEIRKQLNSMTIIIEKKIDKLQTNTDKKLNKTDKICRSIKYDTQGYREFNS